jgi:hypothetical protein
MTNEEAGPHSFCGPALWFEGCLFGLLGGAEVGLDGLVAGEDLVCIFVGDGTGDDDVFAVLPVGWGCDLVLCGELNGVEDAEDLVEVAAGGHGIAELQLDLLVGADDEDGAYGCVGGSGAAFAGVAFVGGEHVVELGDLEVYVADHGVVDLVAGNFFDVNGPFVVVVDGVYAEADDLGSACGELGLQAGHGAEFGGADGGEVLRVGEEDGPVVADPLVEVDGAVGGCGGEVWCFVVDAQ